MLHKQGHLETAAKNYEQAISINPKSSLTHYNLGIAYKNLGNFLKSKNHLIENGLNNQCDVNVGSNYTYNQGIILSALVELYNENDDILLLEDGHCFKEGILNICKSHQNTETIR